VRGAQALEDGGDHESRHEADREALHAASRMAGPALHRRRGLQERSRIGQEAAAGIRQPRPPGGALEQEHAQLPLEQRHLATQHGLRDVQSRGSVAEVELVGDGREVLQSAQVQIDHLPSLTG